MIHIAMPWSAPNWDKEFGEFEAMARRGDVDSAVRAFNVARRTGKAVRMSLEDPLWETMKHTTSGHSLTKSAAIVEAAANGHKIEPIFDAIDKNKDVATPIIMVCEDGTLYKVAGNHRLMACRALRIQPLVWMFQYPPPRPDIESDMKKQELQELKELVRGTVKQIIQENTNAVAPVLGGALLLPVPKPEYDMSSFAGKQDITSLPSSQHHVTLIGIKTLKPQRKLLEKMWPEIAKNLPPSPVPQFDTKPCLAQRDNGKKTWFLPVTNQDELRSYVENIENAIREKVPEYQGGEMRYFHLSIANNRDGNPYESIGDIDQHDVDESNRASQKSSQGQ
jgi:hypothetical protein